MTAPMHRPNSKGSRSIRISQEVFEAMQARAKPFKDTPDSVLRREFGLKPKPRDVRSRAVVTHSSVGPDRCQAITGAGSQCSHKAKEGIHYCGTHWTPERQASNDLPPRVEA